MQLSTDFWIKLNVEHQTQYEHVLHKNRFVSAT